MAQFCWCIIRDALEWSCQPSDIEDLHVKLIESLNRANKNFAYLFGCVAQSLWLIRNDLVFRDMVASFVDVGMYRVLSFFFLQKWKALCKEKEQSWVDLVILKLKLPCYRCDLITAKDVRKKQLWKIHAVQHVVFLLNSFLLR